jgi:hypothetical protein
MGHALREARRVVRSTTNFASNEPPFIQGVLDVRPCTYDPVIYVRLANGQEVRCGPIAYEGTAVNRHRHAEQTTQKALSKGWFTEDAKRDFEWIDEYDTVDDLVTSVEEDWSSRILVEDVALRMMRIMDDALPGAQPVIRHWIGVRLLNKKTRG